MDFEKNISEIETIISRIEKGEINLAQLADEVENAKKIINLCKDELKNIQSKVESLVNNE